jgi:prolyl oligopeptidase PreP (S9A serine peptidase family)
VEIESRHVVIGEAKTPLDLENMHTEKQLEIYFQHISKQASGHIELAVSLSCAGAAHALCRAARHRTSTSVPFRVSGWLFGPGGMSFHEAWNG